MPSRRPLTVTALVLVGLATCIAAVLLLAAEPSGRLPGIALGSELILAVERALVLFGAWMLVLVIVARAIGGDLPSEISGRGVRYADAERTHIAVDATHYAIGELRVELDELRDLVYARTEDSASRV